MSETIAATASAQFELVYARLKRMAGARLAGGSTATLDTTALVHDLYLRIGESETLRFDNQAQFFAYAARAMRHLLADRARDRMRQKAGGEWQRVTLSASQHDVQLAIESAEQCLEIEKSLHALEQIDARAAQVVEMRYFAGLTLEEVAAALGLTRRTVDRDWRFARAFLKSELE